MGITTLHLLPHTVVKRPIKIIYAKILSKLHNAMQIWLITVVFLARYLLFHFLALWSWTSYYRGRRDTQGTWLPMVTKAAWLRTWSSSWLGVSLDPWPSEEAWGLQGTPTRVQGLCPMGGDGILAFSTHCPHAFDPPAQPQQVSWHWESALGISSSTNKESSAAQTSGLNRTNEQKQSKSIQTELPW